LARSTPPMNVNTTFGDWLSWTETGIAPPSIATE
jgi:hypothetical protein